MALGALVGSTIVSDGALQEGPGGDVAGAAGALLIVICLLVCSIVSSLTMIVAWVLGRGPFDHIVLRLAGSVVAGGVIGALASASVPASAAWLVILAAPALLSWPWRRYGG
jgi:hypothetical protein